MKSNRKINVPLLAIAGLILSAVAPSMAMELTDGQKRTILAEAQASFDTGSTLLTENPQKANDAFIKSAEKFQTLVNSGIHNPKLYCDLANAYLQNGQVGRAIANYKLAQRLNPTNGKIEANLRYARSTLPDAEKSQNPENKNLKQTLLTMNARLSNKWKVPIALAAWTTVWIILALGLVWPWAKKLRRPLVIVTCSAVFVIVATSVAFDASHRHTEKISGVITSPQATVRMGNGRGFAEKFDQKLTEGTEFDLIDRRGNWLNIQLNDGKTGWVQTKHACVIEPNRPVNKNG